MMNLEKIILGVVMLSMLVYFILANPIMNDDGFHYEGFTESLAGGHLDFKSFYGFQGLSFFAVPIFWLTRSSNSIIVASAIFSLLSIPLAYLIGRRYYQNKAAGIYFLILFLLTPYPYTTMMRGFQEAALLFFILLIIYASLEKKMWTPVAWAVGGIVKPFALTLIPLFAGNLSNRKMAGWMLAGLFIGGLYLGISYYQTGHFINNAAIGSYEGNFDSSNVPSLNKSFAVGIKGYLRVGASLLLSYRKIMISPFIIILGVISLGLNRGLRLRNNIILAIFLNFLLVGSLTFSFSKYLLPMTTLFALGSVYYLRKYQWLLILALIDSFFVFWPIWSYFGYNYWSNIFIYLLPYWLAIFLFIGLRLYYTYGTRVNYFNTRP